MSNFPGDLIRDPSPNRPGYWVYRRLGDGFLEEVQLTKAEWFALHEHYHQVDLEKIKKLNRHPLNQAAHTVLDGAQKLPSPNEIYLLSLARFAFDDDVPDDDPKCIALADWSWSPGTMERAIWLLEEAEVVPEDLVSSSFEDAADLVLGYLVY